MASRAVPGLGGPRAPHAPGRCRCRKWRAVCDQCPDTSICASIRCGRSVPARSSVRRRCGPRSVSPRCQASGQWLVLWADRGIKVLSLLGPDDGGRAALTPTTLWEPRPNEQLAAEPVVLRAWEGSRQRRFVAWVSQQADALQLWVAPLALDAVPGKAKYFFNLPEVPVRPPALGQRAADVSLTAALFGTEEQLLLCTNRDLFRIALIFSNAGPKMRRPQKLLSRPHFVLNHQELSGLVYLPNLSSRPGEPPGGTLFVAHRAEERAARCVLEVVALTRDRVVESFPCGNPDCYPLDAVTTHGEPGALCRSGGQLVRTDVNGTQIPVHTEERLAGTSRVQVYQDVAVCTGFEQTEGPRQRFFRLVDLRERSLVLNGLHGPDVRAAPVDAWQLPVPGRARRRAAVADAPPSGSGVIFASRKRFFLRGPQWGVTVESLTPFAAVEELCSCSLLRSRCLSRGRTGWTGKQATAPGGLWSCRSSP